MDIKTQIKKTLTSACVLFTVIVAIYTLIVMFLNVDAEAITLDGTRIFLFLIFSLIISLANAIFAIKTVPAFARFIIHFVLSGFAFYLCLLLPISPTSSNLVVGLTLFAIIYLIGAAIVYFFRARYRKLDTEQQTYTKRFTK